jgi:hypothetical protein
VEKGESQPALAPEADDVVVDPADAAEAISDYSKVFHKLKEQNYCGEGLEGIDVGLLRATFAPCLS